MPVKITEDDLAETKLPASLDKDQIIFNFKMEVAILKNKLRNATVNIEALRCSYQAAVKNIDKEKLIHNETIDHIHVNIKYLQDFIKTKKI